MNQRMPVFMCRWPNGAVSFLSARSRKDAIIALDELDNAELAELRQVRDFLVDFRLADSGESELQGFGESCHEEIWDPLIQFLPERWRRRRRLPRVKTTSAGKKSIRAAVRIEKERLVGKKAAKVAGTELVGSIRGQLGAWSALVNRRVKEVATEVLKRAPNAGRKH